MYLIISLFAHPSVEAIQSAFAFDNSIARRDVRSFVDFGRNVGPRRELSFLVHNVNLGKEENQSREIRFFFLFFPSYVMGNKFVVSFRAPARTTSHCHEGGVRQDVVDSSRLFDVLKKNQV